ncbi:MAG TPA: ATP-binding protein, partial [bacterium]|nr:ATP-binding protein [bacterium]
AHDFNNILSPILGYSQLAWYDLPQDSPVRAYLDHVLDAGKRAQALVRQFQEFSGKAVFELQPMAIQPVVDECLVALLDAVPSNVEIAAVMDSQCGLVLANEAPIREVVMNLCDNALDAMKDTAQTPAEKQEKCVLRIELGEIEVTPDKSASFQDLKAGRYVRFVVSDTGRGIDEETRQHLFEPYFTTKPKGEGTRGLGLAVVYGIVKSLDGAIVVQSELGAGSRFEVFLPVCAQPKREKDVCQEERILGGTGRLLFVDDEESILEVSKEFLERIGYQVTTCISPVEALRIFRETPEEFDLVMTDQTMPAMTGIELATALSGIRKDIPIVLCTGFGETLSREEARSRGISQFMEKPVVLPDLAREVR